MAGMNPPNSRPWTSFPDQAFSEALTDYLLQVDAKTFDKKQKKMLWISLSSVNYRRSSWHGPALPYDFENEENHLRLLPAFTYQFKKRGDRWIFCNFRFEGKWKCDPETGNIVVPNAEEWSKIMDRSNHHRQAHGWPLEQTPCYRFLYSSGMCTCALCPNAPRYSELQGSGGPSTVDPEVPSSEPAQSTNARKPRVRFLLSSPTSSCVRFLVSRPEVAEHPSTVTPRKSILKVKGIAPTPSGSEVQDDSWRVDPRLLKTPVVSPRVSPVHAYSTQIDELESFLQTTEMNLKRVQRSLNLSNLAMLDRHIRRSNALCDNQSQSSTEWETRSAE